MGHEKQYDDHTHGHEGAQDHDLYHIMPFNMYIKVAVALFALTLLTMIAFWNNHLLGRAAPFVAFAIAGVKATLVMLFFMHLKYDSVMNRIIFGVGFFFLLVLFGFSAGDIWTRVFETSTL